MGDWGPCFGIPWGPPQEMWVHLANPPVSHRLVASWFTQKGRMPTQTWPTPPTPSLQEPEEAPQGVIGPGTVTHWVLQHAETICYRAIGWGGLEGFPCLCCQKTKKNKKDPEKVSLVCCTAVQ